MHARAQRRSPCWNGGTRAARALLTLGKRLIPNDLLPDLVPKSGQTRPLSQREARPTAPITAPIEFTTAFPVWPFDDVMGYGEGRMAPWASLSQVFAFTAQGGMEGPTLLTQQ